MATQFNNVFLRAGGNLSLAFGTDPTRVFGSTAADVVTIAAGVSVVLDGSFNRGNDTIRFTGNAASYTIVRVNASTVRITDALGTSVTIPVGSAGTAIEFADASRTLSGSSAGILLGNQTVTATPVTLTAGAAPAPVEEYVLTSSAPSIAEGDSGTKTLTYLLTLDKAPTSAVTVNFQTTNAGTAAAGDDFEVVAGVVTFAAGQTAATVSVTVRGDTVVEAEETVVLRLSGSKLVAAVDAVGTIRNDDAAAVDPTDFTVTAGQIAVANSQNAPVTVEVGNSGARTVTIQSDGAAAAQGVIITGDADTTVTSGASADRITLTGNGDNTVTTGAGSDRVTIFGSGNNTVNVGAGADEVTTGAGNDTIVFASGAAGTGDVINAGAGNDTVVISGNGNIIGAGGAALTGVENIVLNGTTVEIDAAALAALVTGGLKSISGAPTTSVVTVTAATGATINLTGVALNDLNNLRVDAGGGNATVILSAAQIAELGSITEVAGNLTVRTSVAGFQALGTKATGSTVTITDTVENLVAAGNTITGVTATLGNATVAQAAAALASGLTVSYSLVDTAANLALAPTNVFRSAAAVTVSGEATAAQASAIQTSIGAANTNDTSPITAGTLTLNVRDNASNVSNYLGDAIDADTVAALANQALTVDQAARLADLNPNATFQIVDTPANLFGANTGGTAQLKLAALNRASQITANGALTVAEVVAINGYTTGAAADLTPGYALVDGRAQLTGATSTVINNAANITANGGPVSVSEALTLEALGNTGATSYVLADTLVNVLAASSQVTASATAVSVSDASLTVANINGLVSKFGTAKVTDASLAVSDTVANLLNLSAGSVAEASGITVSSGTLTAQQALSLKALTGAKMPAAFTVSDTAANLAAAFATTANVAVLELATAINVTGPASVAQIVALNASLAANAAAGLNAVTPASYGLQDTAANLSSGVGTTAAVVTAAASVVITGDVTLTQLGTIDGRAGTGPTGFNLVGTAADLFALGTAVGTPIDRAANVTVTGQTSLAQIQGIAAAYTAGGDDAVLGTSLVYSITDLPSAFDTAVATDLAILNAATTATMVGTKAQIFGGTLTTARRNVADTIIAKDALADLTFTPEQLAEVDAIQINGAVSVANVTAVNALAAAKPTTYTLVNAFAALATPSGSDAEKAAIATLVQGATTVDVTDASLTVADFNTLDGLTAGTIKAAITGNAAQLSAANAATAISSAIATGETVTFTGTVAEQTAVNVAQAATLASRLGLANAGVRALVVTDTAAAIQAAASDLVTAVDSFVVSDNGFITGTVALVSEVYAANATTGSSYGNYAIVDTAAAVAAGPAAHAVNFAQSVTVTGTATQAQADVLGARTAMGPITYSISDTAANVAATTAAGLNGAVNITATGTATLVQAITINGATNSGTTSYAISGDAATLALATAGNEAAIAAINAATGTVTVTGTATGAQATLLAAYTKPVVYDLADTAANLSANTVSLGALNEARNIAVAFDGTDAASIAATTVSATLAARLLGATNSGTTVLGRVSANAAEALGLTLGANDTITTLSVTGTATIADAVAINAKDTGANIGAVTFATVSGSFADLLANKAVANLAGGVTVTGSMTVAQALELDAAITPALTYSIADSFANIMADTTPGGAVDNAAAYAGRSVTVTDTALTLAQAIALRTTGATTYVYSVQDNDANIVAAVNAVSTDAARVALAGAASVRGADGVALTVATVGTTFGIVGTKAQLDGLSTVLQGATKVYEVSVADLAANPDFYVAVGIQFRVTDTAANLTSGNALLPRAAALVATDAASVAQATTLTALGVASVRYSLTDTAGNLVTAAGAGGIVDNAVNVVVTGTATFAQAATIEAETNTGTLTMDISDVAGGFNAGGLSAARNVTVTGALTSANAVTLLAATNSGSTTIANVTGNSAALAALAVGSNDAITAVTPSDAATVAQIVAMKARAGSITSYNLSDTADKLAAADPSILNGATNIALLSGTATVAEAAIINAATNPGTTIFEIADFAANILAPSVAPALLAADASGSVVITDTTVTAAVAAQLRAFDTANAGFTIVQGTKAPGDYAISDAAANLMVIDTAIATAVGISTDVRVTGELTIAEATAVRTRVGTIDGNNTLSYNLADTYSRMVSSLAVTQGAVNVRITNDVSVAQANNAASVDAAVNFGATSAELNMNIRDTANAVAAGLAASSRGIAAAESVSLSTAATVAQAARLSEVELVGGYAISDTAAEVAAAINRANGVNALDRETVLGATSITLTSAATVREALGNRTAEERGLYTIPGLNFAISDTAAAIMAGLQSDPDRVGIEEASAVRLSTTAGITVDQAETLTALHNFVGHDGSGAFNIADAFNEVQIATSQLLADALGVRANGTVNPETIDMSGIGRSVYVNGNGGNDTMFGTDFADIMDGGTGADVMTGGNGRDAFVVAADGIDDGGVPNDERFTDSSIDAFDRIVDFTLATASWTRSAANDTVAEFQALAIGGAGADILDINLAGVTLTIEANAGDVSSAVRAAGNSGGGAAGTVTASVSNGILRISSTNGADFNELSEMIAAAQLVAEINGETLAFEFNNSTYVFTQNGDHDALVQLAAVTGVNGLGLLTGADGTSAGGENWVVIG
jgi:hypothetical protein